MKKLLLIALLVGVCLAAPASAREAKYYVPPKNFSAAFQVMDRGLSNVLGLFQGGTALFAYDTDTKTISHVKLAIEAGSLMTPSRDAGADLMALFDPRAFPEISFMAAAPASFKDGRAEIKGTLTVHGQSKPATFEATLNRSDRGEDETALGLSLRGSFKRADFAMGDAPEMPGRFGETVTLMIEMQAIKP